MNFSAYLVSFQAALSVQHEPMDGRIMPIEGFALILLKCAIILADKNDNDSLSKFS